MKYLLAALLLCACGPLDDMRRPFSLEAHAALDRRCPGVTSVAWPRTAQTGACLADIYIGSKLRGAASQIQSLSTMMLLRLRSQGCGAGLGQRCGAALEDAWVHQEQARGRSNPPRNIWQTGTGQAIGRGGVRYEAQSGTCAGCGCSVSTCVGSDGSYRLGTNGRVRQLGHVADEPAQRAARATADGEVRLREETAATRMIEKYGKKP